MKNILCIVCSILCFWGITGCTNLKYPTPTNVVKVLSNHKIQLAAYRIPTGTFRTVLWPSEDAVYFDITVGGEKERIFQIPVSENLIYDKETNGQWEGFTIIRIKGNRVTYRADNENKHISLEIELPIKKRHYDLCSYQTTSGREVVLFMDLSEFVIDEGLFGYILIDENK
jgi:hypothetical protein